jgi:hypothetical protein
MKSHGANKRSSHCGCGARPFAPARRSSSSTSSVYRALVHELATGRYLAEHVPVLIVGPCGTGKSHLAQALGHRAIRQGVDVLFTTCAQLVATLNAARATGGYDRKLASLARVPLLVIDDFGLKRLRPPADEDLHDLIAERYETTATIATSNLDFTEWDEAFSSLRLRSIGYVTTRTAWCFDGQSYRTPTLPRRRAKLRLQTRRKPRILDPSEMSVFPSNSGSITPIIPGSITPIRDNVQGDPRAAPMIASKKAPAGASG